MKELWHRYIVWPIYYLSPGYRYLHRYLTDKGYTRTGPTWQNDTYEVVPTGHWRCRGFHVYHRAENRWAGWTELDGIHWLEEGIGL